MDALRLLKLLLSNRSVLFDIIISKSLRRWIPQTDLLLSVSDNEVSRKAVADFAVGIYSAARDYASKPQRSVTEINIICEDQDMTKFLCNTVQERLAVDQSMLDSQQGAGPQRENTRQHEASSENNCAICLENKMTNPESLPCGHTFCSACIDDWLKRKPTCPSCNKIHGTLTGKQPPGGRMEMRYSHANLPGCGGSGSFTIEYFIPGGVQTVSSQWNEKKAERKEVEYKDFFTLWFCKCSLYMWTILWLDGWSFPLSCDFCFF